MVRDRLGLFDTPPDRQEIRSSLAVVGLLFGVLCLAFPLRDIRLGEISIFVPLVDSFMLFSELIIATLLYAQASVLRSRAMTVLASGYVFTALILIPHALTFPGAFTTDGLLGAGTNTTAWLAIFRRFTFPIAVISYALLKSHGFCSAEWPRVADRARHAGSVRCDWTGGVGDVADNQRPRLASLDIPQRSRHGSL